MIRRDRAGAVLLVAAVGVVAALVRLNMVWHPSPLSLGTYDDGVHYAAAANLVHGRLPYRDVLFLQPPGIVLALSPFALLGGIVGDAQAFAAARVVFALVGALNAVLIVLLLRRFGVAAAAIGGVLYAVSYPAAYAEQTMTLEVLGTTGVLLGLLLAQRGQAGGGRRWFVLAGVAAGAAIGFKIWYVVPFAVIAAWTWRRAPLVIAGGAAAGLAVYLPFFVTAPALMWRDVVTSQLGRPSSARNTPGLRLRSMLGVGPSDAAAPFWQPTGTVALVLLLLLLLALIVLAATLPGARVYLSLLAASAAVLLLAPSYFQHYAVLTAAPLALVAGAGVARLLALLPLRGAALPAVAVAALLAVAVQLPQDLARPSAASRTAPLAALRPAVARIPGCVVADDPTILILVNRLSLDLARGCAVQADPSGQGYVLLPPSGKQISRSVNPLWQRAILRYFDSANAYLVVRGQGLGLSAQSQAQVAADRVLFDGGRFTIRTAR